MPKYLKSVFILLFLYFFPACTKKTDTELRWEENWAFINGFSFPNSTKNTDYYFKGLVNGQPFNFAADDSSCLSDFVGASVTYSPTNVITNSKTLYLGRAVRFLGQPTLKPPTNFQILLICPWSTTQRSSDSLLRLFLEKQIEPSYAKSSFGTQQTTDSLGFNIDLTVWKIDGIGVGGITGANGDQTSSYIKFKEVIKSPGVYEDYYDVTLSIKCNLYTPTDAGPPVLYKTITDAEMRVRIILPHY